MFKFKSRIIRYGLKNFILKVIFYIAIAISIFLFCILFFKKFGDEYGTNFDEVSKKIADFNYELKLSGSDLYITIFAKFMLKMSVYFGFGFFILVICLIIKAFKMDNMNHLSNIKGYLYIERIILGYYTFYNIVNYFLSLSIILNFKNPFTNVDMALTVITFFVNIIISKKINSKKFGFKEFFSLN